MSIFPTLIVHGFLTNAITNLPVHLALRRVGLRTYNVPIPGWNTQDMAKSSEIVGKTAYDIMKKTGAERINLVGISMGGVIALHYVRCNGGHEIVHRTVTIGSPHHGAPVAAVVGQLPIIGGTAARQMAAGSDIIDALHREPVPHSDIVSIYADGDSVVPPEAARLKGARTVKAPIGRWPLGHYQLVVDPRNLSFMAQELMRQNVPNESSEAGNL